ncbi:MAG: hypothetical protein H7222_07160 [Methylotenera sp.]|nr:hypothetical protein [Oligoflexia bacterium]
MKLAIAGLLLATVLITRAGLAQSAPSKAKPSQKLEKIESKKAKSMRLNADEIDSSDREGIEAFPQQPLGQPVQQSEPSELETREAIFKAQRDLQRARSDLLNDE